MVTPVDEIALQIIGAIGITLPVFLLAVDAFQTQESGDKEDREPYSKGYVIVAISTLITSGFFASGSLIFPPGSKYPKNLLVDISITLLIFGYLGLGSSIYDIMGIGWDDLGRRSGTLAYIIVVGTLVVIYLNTILV